MTINLRAPEPRELKPRITVLGVGGAGGNAVNNMIGARLEGVSFVVANTDAQALAQSKADHKIQLGAELTELPYSPQRIFAALPGRRSG